MGVGLALAQDGLFAHKNAHIVRFVESLFPLQRVGVAQACFFFFVHLHLRRTACHARTTGIARKISGRTIVAVCQNITTFITQLHAGGEVFGKFVTHVPLHIPLVVRLVFIVVADRGQGVIERTECLVLIAFARVFAQQRCRCINHTVAQTRLGSGSVIFDCIGTCAENTGIGVAGSETHRKVLKWFELGFQTQVIAHIIRLFHDGFVVYAIVTQVKIGVLVTAAHTHRLVGSKARTAKSLVLPIDKRVLLCVFVFRKQVADIGIFYFFIALVLCAVVEFVEIGIEIAAQTRQALVFLVSPLVLHECKLLWVKHIVFLCDSFPPHIAGIIHMECHLVILI